MPPKRQQWNVYSINNQAPPPGLAPPPWVVPSSQSPTPPPGARSPAESEPRSRVSSRVPSRVPSRTPSVVSAHRTQSVASVARTTGSVANTSVGSAARPRPPTQPVLYGDAVRMNILSRQSQSARAPHSVAGTAATFVPDQSGGAGDELFGEDYTGWYQKYQPKKGSATTNAATTYKDNSKVEILRRQQILARKHQQQIDATGMVDGANGPAKPPPAPSTIPAPSDLTSAVPKSLTLHAPNTNIRETWSNITGYLKEAASLTGTIRSRSLLAAPRESKTANKVELRATIVKAVGAIMMLEQENRKLDGQWKWDSTAPPVVQKAAGVISQVENWDEWKYRSHSAKAQSKAKRSQKLVAVDEEDEDGQNGLDNGVDNLDDEDENEQTQLTELRIMINDLRISWEMLVGANNYLGSRLPRDPAEKKMRIRMLAIESDDSDENSIDSDEESDDGYIPRGLMEESIITRIGHLMNEDGDIDAIEQDGLA